MNVSLPTHRWPIIFLLGLLTLGMTVPTAAATTQSRHSPPRDGQPAHHHSGPPASLSHPIPATSHTTRRWHSSKYQPTNETTTVDLNHTGKYRLNATYHIPTPDGVSRETVSIQSYLFANHPLSPTIDWVKHGTANKSNGNIRWSGNRAFVFKITFHLPANGTLGKGVEGIQNGAFIRAKRMRPYIRSLGHTPLWKYRLQPHYKAPATHIYTLYHIPQSGATLFYIGNATIKNTTVNGETISLFLPQAAAKAMQTHNNAPTPSQILTAYRTEDKLLPVGVNPPHIRVIVYPPPSNHPYSGGLTQETTIKIWANQPLNQTEPAWLHEFVHTRQYDVHSWMRSTILGPQMKWYDEADANYYADVVAYNENRIGFPDLYMSLNSTSPTRFKGVLANTSTWANHSTLQGQTIEYFRGPSVLGYFDTHIRRQTHGNASFLNVMRTINTQEKHGKNITLTRFKHDLEQYLPNTTVNHAVTAYIKGNHTIPISKRYSAFTLPPTPINTSRPIPPAVMGKKRYQSWLQHRDNTTSHSSVNQPSTQSPTQTPQQSSTTTPSTTTTPTPKTTATTTTTNTPTSTSTSTSTSSPGFGINIALTAIVIASALEILRFRRSP